MPNLPKPFGCFAAQNSSYFKRKITTLIFLTVMFFLSVSALKAQTCAVPGKDNPATISGVVNTYFPSPSTATASGTSLPVAAVTNVESATTPIAAGDLLLVIQMQDASINTSNTSSYGAGTGTGNGFTSGNAGYYEYAVATNSVGISGGTVITVSNLTRTYNSSAPTATRGKQTYQVIRIPQYSTATISGTLQAATWDGTSGGIVGVDVAGTLNLGNGTISAAGKGFRGGLGRSAAGGSGTNTDYVALSSSLSGGSKGEGIVGTPRYVWNSLLGIDTGVEGLPSGSYDRGAPGNAGGGGTDGNPVTNDQNSGGGGGGNGGAGGQGGNSWSSNLAVGGVGGAAFTSAANRLTMGGGGGAGTTNNGSETTSSGASGGGIVMLRVGSFSGSGTINVNGSNAQDSNPNCCGDGAGGGGAGGSIIVTASNTSGLTGITATAKGGNGGDTLVATAFHGPGGGGGGGAILANGSLGSTNASGGANGTTTSSNSAYGAAAGLTGYINLATSASSINGTSSGAQCIPSLTVTKTTSTAAVTNTNAGVAATYTITVSNLANRADATQVSLSDTLPQPVANGFTYASTGTITLNGGATRPTTTNPTVGATVPAWSVFTIPGGGSVALTFTVNVAPGVASGTYQNPATATYLNPARTTTGGTTTASYNSASSTGEDVTVTSRPNIALVKSCSLPANCITTVQPPDTDLTFKIQFTNTGAMTAANFVIVDAVPANTDFKLTSAAATVGTTGLTFAIEYSADYNSANPTAATWTYTPVSAGGGAAAGYDRLVKAVRWRVTAGTLPIASPNNTGDVSFVTKIR